MNTENKEMYEAPATRVVVVRTEGITCQSYAYATRGGYGTAEEEDEWD